MGQGPVRILAVRLASYAHECTVDDLKARRGPAMSRLGHAHVSFDVLSLAGVLQPLDLA